MDTEICQTDP